MNDLGWIKYDPQRMFCDTAGMSAAGERAHRRLMDFLWLNDGPPEDDNTALQAITQTSPQDWGRVRLELKRKGWLELAGRFLHRGAIKSLNEAKETYLANYNRTCRASGRPERTLQFDPETGVGMVVDVTAIVTKPVTRCVTDTVTPSVTDAVTGGTGTVTGTVTVQEGGNARPREPETVGDQPEIPTEEQAVAFVMADGIPEPFVRLVYQDWLDTGGKNGAGRAVSARDLPGHIRKRWRYEAAEWKEGLHRGHPARAAKGGRTARPDSAIDLGNRIRAISKQLQSLQGGPRLAAMIDGQTVIVRDDHGKLLPEWLEHKRKLKAELSRLESQLTGVGAST